MDHTRLSTTTRPRRPSTKSINFLPAILLAHEAIGRRLAGAGSGRNGRGNPMGLTRDVRIIDSSACQHGTAFCTRSVGPDYRTSVTCVPVVVDLFPRWQSADIHAHHQPTIPLNRSFYLINLEAEQHEAIIAEKNMQFY